LQNEFDTRGLKDKALEIQYWALLVECRARTTFQKALFNVSQIL